MSGDERPPKGPWADVLDEVREALDDAGVGAGELRDGLIRGVRDALDALQHPPSGAPDVTVVDGGREDDAPPSDGPPPDLRVADPASEPVAPSDRAPAAPPVSAPVRRAATAARSDLSATGVFALEPGGSQTLYRADAPHPYRVACDAGAVRVGLDGAPAEWLRAGQTLDVCARLVRVLADTDAGAAGRYARLP